MPNDDDDGTKKTLSPGIERNDCTSWNQSAEREREKKRKDRSNDDG